MPPGGVDPARPQTQAAIAQAVTTQLIALAGGKQIAKFVARRIPVLGGAIGGAGDALSTRRIGRKPARIPWPPGPSVGRPPLRGSRPTDRRPGQLVITMLV
ncbi:MAG: hypothetical protein ABIR83_03345 [Nakamurella sp.]